MWSQESKGPADTGGSSRHCCAHMESTCTAAAWGPTLGCPLARSFLVWSPLVTLPHYDPARVLTWTLKLLRNDTGQELFWEKKTLTMKVTKIFKTNLIRQSCAYTHITKITKLFSNLNLLNIYIKYLNFDEERELKMFSLVWIHILLNQTIEVEIYRHRSFYKLQKKLLFLTLFVLKNYEMLKKPFCIFTMIFFPRYNKIIDDTFRSRSSALLLRLLVWFLWFIQLL